MKNLALLSTLALVTPSAPEDSPAEEFRALYPRALMACNTARYDEARKLLEAFLERRSLRKRPDLRLSALQLLARVARAEGNQREAAVLRQLFREFPDAYVHDTTALARLASVLRLEPLSIPNRFPSGRECRFRVPWRGRTAHYRVYRIPTARYVQGDWRNWKKHVRRGLTPSAPLPLEEWTEILSLKTPNAAALRLPADMASPGVYALREDIKGVSILHPFELVTFEVVCTAAGRDGIAFAVDPWSGSSVEGVRLEVRSTQRGASGVEDNDNSSRGADGSPSRSPAPDVVASGVTDADGLFRFELPAAASLVSVLARRGNEVRRAVLEPDDYASPEDRSLVYITTDRPLYRPGHTVHFKAVRRDFRATSLRLPEREQVRVEIRDPTGRVLWRENRTWNENGSLTGSFTLAAEPPLGRYEVVVDVENVEETYFEGLDEPLSLWSRHFTVAAYRKPEMSVAVSFPGGAPAPGGEVTARITAAYFFGGPVAGAEVRWRVRDAGRPSSKCRFPPSFRPPLDDPRSWIWDRPDPEDIWWEDEEWFDFDFEEGQWQDDDDEETVTAEGRGVTSPGGTLDIKFRAGEDPRAYLVEAVLRDLSHLTASASGTIELSERIDLRIATDHLFYLVGERIEAQIRVRDADATPLAGRAVELVAFLSRERDDEDESREYESFFRADVRTDATGFASVPVPVPAPVKARLLARLEDDGRRYEDRVDIVCAPSDAAEPTKEPAPAAGGDRDRYGDEDESLELEVIPDRVIYEPGETMRLLVISNHAPRTVLLALEGERLHHAQAVRLARRRQVVELPARVDMAPNVFVTALGVSCDWIRLHRHEVFVYPRERFLDVSLTTDREEYAPGERAAVHVETTALGTPAEAEVELAVVDEAIFALAADETEDIRAFFHPLRYGDGHLWGSLWDHSPSSRSVRDRLWDIDLAGQFACIDFADSSETEDLPAPRFRREFPDTCHWAGQVRTDRNGHAKLEFEVPDSLTEWRVIARAVSGADRFGSGVSSMLSRQDVVLRLVAPRFLTERDHALVSTIVHNHLDHDEDFVVDLVVEGARLELTEDAGRPRRVRVAAGGSQRTDWRLAQPTPGRLRLRGSARAAGGSDGVELEIPVLRSGVEFRLTAAGKVGDSGWTTRFAVPRQGMVGNASLEVIVTGPGVAAVRGALGYLAGYPYGCVEQTMSRFLPAVVALEAMGRIGVDNERLRTDLPAMIDQGLQRLYGFQHDDGGWGWWKGDETNADMTSYVLFGLATARRAGVEVDELAWKTGLEALSELDATPPLGLYARALGGEKLDTAKFPEAETVADRAILTLAGKKELARGLTLEPGRASSPEGIVETALALRALQSVDPEDGRIPELVERLLAERRGRAWHSTLDTAWAVLALADRLEREVEPQVEVRVDGKARAPKDGRLLVDGLKLEEGDVRVDVRRTDNATPASPVFASTVLRYRGDGSSRAKKQEAFGLRRVLERSRITEKGKRWHRIPTGGEVRIGEELRVVVTTRARGDEEFVLIECPIPAGTEALPYDPDAEGSYCWYYDEGLSHVELRDERVTAAAHEMGEGESCRLIFKLRPTRPGTYQVLPAQVFAMYDPDRRGTSRDFTLRVVE